MPVPPFQSLLRPFLTCYNDGEPHTTQEVADMVANLLNLTQEERTEKLPSGKQGRFQNRIAWAAAHFKGAKAIEMTKRGTYKITPRGKEFLGSSGSVIRMDDLLRYPEYRSFRGLDKGDAENKTDSTVIAEQTPEESLESSFQSLQNELAHRLLEVIKSCSSEFFEKLVVDLLVAMGYGGSRAGAGQRVGQTGDGGVDGLIKEDKLGLDIIYLQAKRWEGVVGRPAVQGFAGSLEGHRAKKGVMLTTSRFSADAIEYVTKIEKKIVLIDGEELARLMIEHSVGVSVSQTYVMKRIDSDYFETND